ncbi:PQ loop repeat-domain-containing protein [Gautieria morchelliformis]|nr:PQ loop repeat-domain-containing protein [Gautieria morchelliformis]
MVREEVFSVLLGYASIASWLGAQFPQIIVNWRLKSVDGLALPFLANWLLGDATNLIGCLLTDQLPFQTYLATYFVCVDICLVSQFLYYYAPRHTKPLSILTTPSALQSRTSLIRHSPEARTFPRERISQSRSASRSLGPHRRIAVASASPTQSDLDYRHQDPLASEADVRGYQARLRSRGSRRGSSLEGLPESVVADLSEREWGGRRFPSLERDVGEEAVDAESESAPSIMIDSFHSEGGGRGRGRGKHVSWTQESSGRDNGTQRIPLLDDVGTSSTAPSTMRGRQLTRLDMSPIATEAPISETHSPRTRRTSAASTVSAGASRRSASIVFLGIFALFSLSSYPGIRRSVGSEGRVLSMPPISAVLIPEDMSSSSPFPHPTTLSLVAAPDTVVELQDLDVHLSASNENQRLIGRVSAWTCTTLYLTSRLPQIWKNFVRKSVEGLSMYLFIFAFLGNFFYVLSILTNPKMDLPAPLARQFIRDSIPYILGSGGTFLFDITIVLQSCVYDPNRRGTRNRARQKNVVAASEDEQRALLATDRVIVDAC